MKWEKCFILTLILMFVIGLTSTYAGSKPRGVTTISGLDYWRVNLPTKGGNSFIILEQFDNDCGPTSAEMVLYYYGKWVNQRDIWDKGGIHTVVIGTFPGELKRALNGLGVPVLRLSMGSADYATNSWQSREIKKQSRQPSANYDPFPSLRRKIRQNRPPMILLRMGALAYHWVVVVGYDNQNRYLIADPSGFFEWWSKADLDIRWSFRKVKGPRTRGAFKVSGDDFVRMKADPYTMVVPKKSPTSHWGPMWSDMQVTQVTGKSKLNWPTFKGFRTHRWQHTFYFPAEYSDPDWYTLAAVTPAQVRTAGGTTKGWIEGSAKTSRGEITVWGQIEYGKTTRGKLWIVVRVFRKGIKRWVAPLVEAG